MQNQSSSSSVTERGAEECETVCLEPDNMEKLDALRYRISGLIGETNVYLLREYTGRLIAQFNTDSDWFYRKWLEDAGRTGTAASG
jgi:hypothetical protein